MITSFTRRALLTLAAGACLAAAGNAWAQDTGAIVRLVVPFGAGTTTDTNQVAKASPDGSTLLLGTVGTHAINATLFRNLPYDPQKNFVPIAFVGYTPLLLVVPSNSSAKSPKDLVAMAQRPQGITFASAGNGTSGHLAGELLSKLGGKMIHVPYKEGSQALTDLISGNVDFMFYHPTAVVPHMKSGKLRALGVSSAVRSPLAQDVPTLAEQGFSDFDLIAWFMLYAPADTPAPVVEQLRKGAATALGGADTQARLVAQGVELRRMRSDELAAFNAAEIRKWADLVKRSGAQVD